MTGFDWRDAYLCMSPPAALKHLETPFVYHIARDELYEIDETAAEFLLSCNGTKTGRDLTSDADFVEYCIEEGILNAWNNPNPTNVDMGEKISPSLRYLELHLTHQCNLRCAHCYIGDRGGIADMPVSEAVAITREFSDMGGLRLLISGGEPLVYKGLESYLREISGLKVRRVLLTNGMLIDWDTIKWLDVHEIQFSLDGWQAGHDRLRGGGAFARLMEGIRAAQAFGVDISFSTMVHPYNTDQFDRMAAFVKDVEAVEWGIDVPCRAGPNGGSPYLFSDYDVCTPLMTYGFGGGHHGSTGDEDGGYACGRHLMTVMPDGRAAKCGFYMDRPTGDARTGLRGCWEKIEHLKLSDLECAGCPVIQACRGGCRFRAPTPLAPDPVMCSLHGVLPEAVSPAGGAPGNSPPGNSPMDPK